MNSSRANTSHDDNSHVRTGLLNCHLILRFQIRKVRPGKIDHLFELFPQEPEASKMEFKPGLSDES